MSTISFTPIGIIHTPFKQPKGTPIQPKAGKGVRGTIDLDPTYAAGLADLDGFSHIILLFHCHLSGPFQLTVKPFLDDQPRGLFATRAPSRPSPIGLSTVRLLRIEETTLHIEDVDMVDGTPLLDIKPYVPAFDEQPAVRLGWFEERLRHLPTTRDDGRFVSD
jgi:tRNA-Thr(GGU) m(6)t(6)A37 methyltransferase TsaA